MWKRLAFPQQASVTPLSNVTWQEACGFASGVSGFTLVCVRFCVSTAPHSVNNLAFVVINTVSVVPTAVCLSHDCLGHLRYLVVLYKIGGIFFFYFCERCHWNFVKDCIESIADLCSMDTLIMSVFQSMLWILRCYVFFNFLHQGSLVFIKTLSSLIVFICREPSLVSSVYP